MDKFNEIYLELMPIATSFGTGYEATQGDWLKVACYSIMTVMLVGDNIFSKLNENSRVLEKKI